MVVSFVRGNRAIVDSDRVPVCLAIIGTAREAAGQRSVVLDVVVVRLFQAANALALRLKLADQLRVVCAERCGSGDRVRNTVVARQCRGGRWASGSVETLHEEVVLAFSELHQTAGGRSLENDRCPGLLLKATGRRGLERVVVFHLGEREFAVLGELPEAAAGLLL